MEADLKKVMATGVLIENTSPHFSAEAFRRLSTFGKAMMVERMRALAAADRKYRDDAREKERGRMRVMAPGAASAISALRGIEAETRARNVERRARAASEARERRDREARERAEAYGREAAERERATRERAKTAPFLKYSDYFEAMAPGVDPDDDESTEEIVFGGQEMSPWRFNEILTALYDDNTPEQLWDVWMGGEDPSSFSKEDRKGFYRTLNRFREEYEEAGVEISRRLEGAKKAKPYAHTGKLARLAQRG